MEDNEVQSGDIAATLAPSVFPDATFTNTTSVANVVPAQTLTTSAFTVNGVVAAMPHPALSVTARLRDKANSMGSFVVGEIEALISEIESHLK